MKIQCDVCDRDEASVYCVADEASLCAACDSRVHHANKLAGKHHRFSLHHPSPSQSPLCDICQERRAFLFCQQDRAILCRECDIPIHKANSHTQKHTRFLLTGVKLSVNSTLYSESSSSPSSVAESAASSNDNNNNNKPVCINPTRCTPSTAKCTTVQTSTTCEKKDNDVELISAASSIISEYLIEMLPGWHVEDFLESPSPSPCGFHQIGENDLLPFWDAGLDQSNMSVFPTEKMGIWVPQVPPPPLHHAQNQSMDLVFGLPNGLKEQSKEFNNNNSKSSRKRSDDNTFAVPQISPHSSATKKSRNIFW